jgi:hypothetical protein
MDLVHLGIPKKLVKGTSNIGVDGEGVSQGICLYYTFEKDPVAIIRKRTIPTERPPLVGEVSAKLCG